MSDHRDAILAGLLDGAGHASCESCRDVMRQAHALIGRLTAEPARALAAAGTIDVEIAGRDYRSELPAERAGARDASVALRALVRAVGVVYGEPLGLALERRLEAQQERYEDALITAERLIEQLDRRINAEEPF